MCTPQRRSLWFHFKESVWCGFNDVNNGCIYRSPNSSAENTQEMYKMLKDDTLFKFTKVCIVGDFNFPTIKWKGEWSGNIDNEFIECIRCLFNTDGR